MIHVPTLMSAASTSIRVLLFSVLREGVGTGELRVSLPEAATGSDLLDRLGAEHAEVARHRPTIRLAVNRRYVPVETALADGDEVALITPVSGG